MKKLLVLFGIVLSYTTYLHAQGSEGLMSDTGQVTLSMTITAPTHVLNKDPFVTGTWIVNQSTFTLYMSSVSAGMSTSTSFALPPTSTSSVGAPIIWSPDGKDSPYMGDLYIAASAGTVAPVISVWRTH